MKIILALVAIALLASCWDEDYTDCCKVCDESKACGDSCIPINQTCHSGYGCACNALGEE
jgi:hypothetical protein